MKESLIKYKAILIVLVVFIFLLSIVLITNLNSTANIKPYPSAPKPSIEPVTFDENIAKKIVPDKSTEKEAIMLLGEPTSTHVKKNYNVLNYLIPNTTRVNKIYANNGIVKYYSREIVTDNSEYKDYLTKTKKQEDGVLYDLAHHNAGFSWYIFGQDGVAYLANKSNGYALQVIYFPPMSYEEFVQTIASDFSLLRQAPSDEHF